MWRAFSPILLGLAPHLLAAQAIIHPGTGLHVLGGTTLHLPDGLSMTVAPGAFLINDGTIHLAPLAVLAEAVGSPVTGLGVERIDMMVNSAPNELDPGGLGLTISAGIALDSLSLERGHTALSDTSGASGIARWYRARPQVNTGLSAEIGFRYDLTELQGIAEADLMLYAARQGDSIWQGIPSAVDLPLSTVFATFLDSLGTFTLFDGTLGTGTVAGGSFGNFHAGPNPATEVLDVHDETSGFRRLSVIDPMGRTVMHADPGHRTTHYRLTVSGLASGSYLLRTEDGRSLRFNRP